MTQAEPHDTRPVAVLLGDLDMLRCFAGSEVLARTFAVCPVVETIVDKGRFARCAKALDPRVLLTRSARLARPLPCVAEHGV